MQTNAPLITSEILHPIVSPGCVVKAAHRPTRTPLTFCSLFTITHSFSVTVSSSVSQPNVAVLSTVLLQILKQKQACKYVRGGL